MRAPYTEERRIADMRVICKTGGRPMTTCKHCGAAFEFKNTPRAKVYCTTRCRMRAARDRRAGGDDADHVEESSGLTTTE